MPCTPGFSGSFFRIIVKNTENSISSRLQNVDVLTGEGLVHAADSTEFTTHTAGIAVVVLRETVITDLLKV